MKAKTGRASIESLLKRHPHIDSVELLETPDPLIFGDEAYLRQIWSAKTGAPEYGLLELIDNNPLVCTDEYSVPSLPVTAGLVCLGPLLLSGLIAEEPTFLVNRDLDEAELDQAVQKLGWTHGVLFRREEFASEEVLMASASAVIDTPEDPEELADLFDEKFAKSLLIEGAPQEEWTLESVKGTAKCRYKIALNGDGPQSLVTVRVLCDATGTFEAAQIVNAMNVMCGYPDELGLIR